MENFASRHSTSPVSCAPSMLSRLTSCQPAMAFWIARSTVDFTGTLDQTIFSPPTVFSYYQPEYEVPGTKIQGPAFGILSTSTTLRRANDINSLVYTGVASNTTPTALSPDRPRGTSIDIANLEALAGNPNDIADALNRCCFTEQCRVRCALHC